MNIVIISDIYAQSPWYSNYVFKVNFVVSSLYYHNSKKILVLIKAYLLNQNVLTFRKETGSFFLNFNLFIIYFWFLLKYVIYKIIQKIL